MKTREGWRFSKRSYYEGKWGEPNVPTPPPVSGVRALQEGVPGPSSRGPRLSDADHIEIQQLVARLPYEIDMNADNGAAYASGLVSPDTRRWRGRRPRKNRTGRTTSGTSCSTT